MDFCNWSDLTHFLINLSHLVFSGTEHTSVNLQRNDTLVQALTCSELAVNYIKRLRTDDSFKQFYTSTVQQAKEYTGEPSLPHYQ